MRLRVAWGAVFAVALWLVIGSFGPVAADSPTAGSSPVPSAVPAASQAPVPSPSPDIVATIDPRSNGQGPGLVGSPFEILVGVVLLGGAAAGGTLLYLRFTRRG